jgi:C1A family cysteine protease
MDRLYAALTDTPDSRDHLAAPPSIALPPSTNLQAWMPQVTDQGQEGACTAFAGAAILSWLLNKFQNRQYVFSPQFLYRAERLIEGDPGVDQGAQSRTMMACLKDVGCCMETSDPYTDGGWKDQTNQTQLAEARNYQIGAYHRVQDFETLKSVLASGYVASLNINVYDSFESDAVGATGIVPMPAPTEALKGGHEVVCVGYDDASQTLLVRNSWGQAWGDQGYFHLPYDYWSNVNDCWTAHLGPAWK